MRLKVIGLYHSPLDNCPDVVCVDEQGKKHIVDFLIDGTLPHTVTCRDDLIGKTIEVAYLSPFVEIAAEPRIVDEAS